MHEVDKNSTKTEPDRFRALYFPYSRCLREVDLKRMVLIFDEILFVDPLSQDLAHWPGQYPIPNQGMHIRIMQDSDRLKEGYFPVLQRGIGEHEYPFWDWYQIREIYEYLKEKRVVRLVDPAPIVQANDSLLAYALAYDLLAGTSCEAGMTPFFFDRDDKRNPKWIIHKDRIPSILGQLSEDESFWGDASASLGEAARGFKPSGCQFLVRQALEQAASSKAQISVHYDLAYSLVLSQALLLADEFSADPVTDNGWVHHSLIRKCERLYSESDSKAVIYRRTPSDSYKDAILGLNLVGQLIPDEALDSLSFEQVVNYREKNHDLLGSLWSRVQSLATECETEMSSGSFPKKVKAIVESKLRPELEELDRELRESFRQMFSKSAVKLASGAAKAVAPAVPTVSLAALYGLTLGQVVGLGVSTLLVGIGIALPNVVESLTKRQSLRKTGLAYLLNIPNERRPR